MMSDAIVVSTWDELEEWGKGHCQVFAHPCKVINWYDGSFYWNVADAVMDWMRILWWRWNKSKCKKVIQFGMEWREDNVNGFHQHHCMQTTHANKSNIALWLIIISTCDCVLFTRMNYYWRWVQCTWTTKPNEKAQGYWLWLTIEMQIRTESVMMWWE
jgi:hypothetical protein